MTEAEIDSLLMRHFAGAKLEAIGKLTGGVSAEVLRIDIALPGGTVQRIVVREQGTMHCGHDAALEFALLKALHAAGRAVPKPLGFRTSRADGGHPYVVLEFVEGSTSIEASAVAQRIAAMADELAAIHTTAVGPLPALPLRLDPVPELFEMLPDDAEWDELREGLAGLENTAFVGPPVLLHGDYWPNNVIWRDGIIAAVIDWEDAAIGDPLSDVACACLELRYLYGDRGAELFRASYARHREIDPFRLALWQAYVAAAGSRSMDNWGLDPARVSEMRMIARKSIMEAEQVLSG